MSRRDLIIIVLLAVVASLAISNVLQAVRVLSH
jgi:hypothetical protein